MPSLPLTALEKLAESKDSREKVREKPWAQPKASQRPKSIWRSTSQPLKRGVAARTGPQSQVTSKGGGRLPSIADERIKASPAKPKAESDGGYGDGRAARAHRAAAMEQPKFTIQYIGERDGGLGVVSTRRPMPSAIEAMEYHPALDYPSITPQYRLDHSVESSPTPLSPLIAAIQARLLPPPSPSSHLPDIQEAGVGQSTGPSVSPSFHPSRADGLHVDHEEASRPRTPDLHVPQVAAREESFRSDTQSEAASETEAFSLLTTGHPPTHSPTRTLTDAGDVAGGIVGQMDQHVESGGERSGAEVPDGMAKVNGHVHAGWDGIGSEDAGMAAAEPWSALGSLAEDSRTHGMSAGETLSHYNSFTREAAIAIHLSSPSVATGAGSWAFSHRSLRGGQLSRGSEVGGQVEDKDNYRHHDPCALEAVLESDDFGSESEQQDLRYIPTNVFSGWKLTTPAEKNRIFRASAQAGMVEGEDRVSSLPSPEMKQRAAMRASLGRQRDKEVRKELAKKTRHRRREARNRAVLRLGASAGVRMSWGGLESHKRTVQGAETALKFKISSRIKMIEQNSLAKHGRDKTQKVSVEVKQTSDVTQEQYLHYLSEQNATTRAKLAAIQQQQQQQQQQETEDGEQGHDHRIGLLASQSGVEGWQTQPSLAGSSLTGSRSAPTSFMATKILSILEGDTPTG